MDMSNLTTITSTVQGRDTSVPAASSARRGCSSSLSNDRLTTTIGVDPKTPMTGSTTGSKKDGETPRETNGTPPNEPPVFFFRGGSKLKSPTKQRLVDDSLILEMEKELKGLAKFCTSKKNMFLEVKGATSPLSILVRQIRTIPLHGKETVSHVTVATEMTPRKGSGEFAQLSQQISEASKRYAAACQQAKPDAGESSGKKRPLPSPETAQKSKEPKRKKEEEEPFILATKKKKKERNKKQSEVIVRRLQEDHQQDQD